MGLCIVFSHQATIIILPLVLYVIHMYMYAKLAAISLLIILHLKLKYTDGHEHTIN